MGGTFEMISYTITKKVAKHGKQAIIVVPKLIQDDISPGTIVEVSFKVIRESKNE